MAESLTQKEIHIFNRLGQNLAFDVNDMNLFEINQMTREIFQQVNGKTPDELTAILSDHFPSTEVLHVLSKLMELDLVGYQLPKPAAHTSNTEQEPKTPHHDGIKQLVLFVSQDCNLNCRYCYIQHGGHIQKKYMSEEVARAAVDLLFQESHKVTDLGISFYGGEPMLQFDLIKKIIPYATRKAGEFHKTIKYTMTTNGTLLTDKAIEFLSANNVKVMVSLDGPQKIHDENRVFVDGSGSFSSAFSAFIKLKTKDKNTRTLTVMRSFDSSMTDIAQSLLDLGSHNFSIHPALSNSGELIIPRVKNEENEECSDSVDIYTRQYEEMVAYFLDNEMMFQEKPPFDFTWVFEKLKKRDKQKKNCGAAYTRFSVDTAGNILPCEHFIGEPAFYMGNVLTGLDRHQQNIKELEITNITMSETCRTCWCRNLCDTWCFFYSFKYSGDLKKPVEAQCRIIKNYFEIAMGVYSIRKRRKKNMQSNHIQEETNVQSS
ncbi:MAG: SPASM domain-containing protein [Acidobacteria bacterium]|jgi:uncharacterized protein|nr:SPASM domain-containing protein [Acidobacteriota bacterium]